MKTYSLNLTLDELCEVRSLISSKILEAQEALARTGNSNDALDRKLFDYWYDKYQVLKSSYDKLFQFFSRKYDELSEVINEK